MRNTEMWDFDPDEWAFFAVAAIAGALLAARYYKPLLSVWNVPPRQRACLAFWPIPCLAIILIALSAGADPQVRGHWDYMTLFLAGGVLWIFAAAAMLPIVGVSMRDDVVERRNPAAAIIAAAAMLASAVCYAGANIGRGATIWTTIVPALVAAAELAVAGAIVRLISPVAEAVAIDRDIRSAAIFAAFLIATALILARAAAGDFVDWDSTFADFAASGPWAAIAMGSAVAALWIVRPRVVRRIGGEQ